MNTQQNKKSVWNSQHVRHLRHIGMMVWFYYTEYLTAQMCELYLYARETAHWPYTLPTCTEGPRAESCCDNCECVSLAGAYLWVLPRGPAPRWPPEAGVAAPLRRHTPTPCWWTGGPHPLPAGQSKQCQQVTLKPLLRNTSSTHQLECVCEIDLMHIRFHTWHEHRHSHKFLQNNSDPTI